MNKVEPVVISGGVPKDALVMSASDYAEWEQSRALDPVKSSLNRAQHRALKRSNRRAK